jgi:hypothetical protein
MPLIYVRSRPGRKAYFEGQVIPEDKFVPVMETTHIRRLRDYWGDIEVEGGGETELSPPLTSRRRAPPPGNAE